MDIKQMHEKPPYGMIAILFIGAFVAFLNNTLLNVALPTIMDEFYVKPSVVQWLTTGYMLDQWNFNTGKCVLRSEIHESEIVYNGYDVVYFGDASRHFGAVIWHIGCSWMIQASGSAMMMPLLMNIMLTAFPIERRGQQWGFSGLS